MNENNESDVDVIYQALAKASICQRRTGATIMNQYNESRSTDINLIAGALAKAQGSYEPLVANEEGKGGKFANLQAILLATRKALSDNGIALHQYRQFLDEGSGASILRTVLLHESGQWLGSCSRIVPGQTFRETFNAIESYKRLDALLVLGIAPVGKDPLLYDDNGVEQAERVMIQHVRNPNLAISKSVHAETISKQEYDDLMWELEGYPDIAKNLQKFYNIESIADLPREQLYVAKAQIRKIKKAHEEYAVGRLKE